MIRMIILSSIVFFCCVSTKPKSESNNMNLGYKVYKIDSLNSYYLIYAKREDSFYKILSKKEYPRLCDQIQEGAVYKFKLHSLLKNRQIAGKEVLPQNSLLVNCFSFDDSTSICIEKDSINDLHAAENIKGLCYLK